MAKGYDVCVYIVYTVYHCAISFGNRQGQNLTEALRRFWDSVVVSEPSFLCNHLKTIIEIKETPEDDKYIQSENC